MSGLLKPGVVLAAPLLERARHDDTAVVRDAADDPDPPEDLPVDSGQHETVVPDAAAIRGALAECMTLSDVDDAMGWARGTARMRRPREFGLGPVPMATTPVPGCRACPSTPRRRRPG